MTQIHPRAQHAAEGAEAAGARGRFWEMHDWLFEHQRTLEDAYLTAEAERLGLDVDRLRRELDERVHERRVREDFLGGVRSGVNGTPTFFVNGLRHDEAWDLETLLETLEAALVPR